MLRIRPEQMTALTGARLAPVKALIAERFGVRNPDYLWDIPADAVRGRVDAAIDRAVGHGLTRLSDLFDYVELDFAFGEDFDRGRSDVRRVLGSPHLSGQAKVETVTWILYETGGR